MERRQSPRKRISCSLTVRDLSREIVLGQLVDFSLTGLMLLATEDIPVGRVYQLSLEFPELSPCGDEAVFGAESLWAESSLEPSKYWVGFHIIDISPEYAECIRCLFETADGVGML
jgi:hypothetical protein